MDKPLLSRREAAKIMGLSAAALAVGAASSSAAEESTPESLIGYKDGQYVLPPLPYAPDALEPHIDAETMRIHHDILHANYVKGANRATAALAEIASGKGDPSMAKAWERELAFHGSGHALHTLFWNNMSPNGGGKPDGKLAEAINASFGSFDNFVTQMTAAAVGVEGSGWALLSYEPMSKKFIILQVEKQQNLTFQGATPLLGCDVWEHAYFLKYQSKRADYVKAWFEVINWPDVAARYAKVTA